MPEERQGLERLREARDHWLALGPDERAVEGPRLVAVCADAVRQLVARLQAMGYPVDPMIQTCTDVDGAVAEIEAVGPPVPPALVELWRVLGTIQLVDLEHFRHMEFWDRRLGPEVAPFACDGVVVEGPSDDGWLGYVVDSLYEQAEYGEDVGVVLGPDDLHKDNTSGSGPYLLVSNEADPWSASLAEFGWGRNRPVSAPDGATPDLLSYLRTAVLECGGFPGYAGFSAFEAVRLELTEGLPVF